MNQKLKEIANNDGITYLYDYSADGHAVVLNLTDLEDFAKSLITECARFTDPVTRIHMFKHFGIEE